MGEIFRSNIDASSERLVITNLTNDLIDFYSHDDIASNFCYEVMMMLQEVKGGEYVKYCYHNWECLKCNGILIISKA